MKWSRIWYNNWPSVHGGLVLTSCMRHSHVFRYYQLSLNSIDVLSGLISENLYHDLDGRIDHYPASLEQLKRCKPIFMVAIFEDIEFVIEDLS